MNSLDDIFEMPEKKNLNNEQKEEINIDAETEPTKPIEEKKPRKKHNIPPEKLEIMRANLKKGRDAIKAKKEARLKSEIKEQLIKEMTNKPKVEVAIEKPKVEVIKPKVEVAISVDKPKIAVIEPPKPYIIKSTFKKPIW